MIAVENLTHNCTEASTEDTMEDTPDVRRIREQLQQWSDTYSAKDLEGNSLIYTKDGKYLNPNATILQGREACKQVIQGLQDVGYEKIHVDTQEIEVAGTWAWVQNNFTGIYRDGQQVKFKTLEVWKKEDGDWLIYRIMYVAM